ncbi:K02A2.6-like [Cordylochernes scorpioides]|uniref:K02A2.6-like n=1 Tax=Cordylochernes scorpioides TaxID=51811 RepID=A0ABY6KPR1_9ARAC|nr:K02A2.6-like [Cordylochernes scorpioides]
MLSTIKKNDNWPAIISINGNITPVQLDTGAQVNILPRDVFESWSAKPRIVETKRTFEFIVAEVNANTLISCNTSEVLEIIKRINAISYHSSVQAILNQYQSVFQGTGVITEEFKWRSKILNTARTRATEKDSLALK